MSHQPAAKTRLKGSRRMKELGYKQVHVWLDEAELKAIRGLHPSEPLATLLRRLACEDAGHQFHAR